MSNYHGQDNRRGPYGDNRGYDYAPPQRGGGMGLLRRVSWGAAIVGIAIWSLIALVAFLLADPVLAWLSAAMGVALSTGKDAASVLGAGEIAGILVDSANATGLPELAMNLLNLLAKPAIVVVWLLGVVVMLILPALAGKAAQLGNRFRR